jgi:predicted Fe-S protein YdhL (DUF1289 family)
LKCSRRADESQNWRSLSFQQRNCTAEILSNLAVREQRLFADAVVMEQAPPEYRKYRKVGFATPSGKVELASSVLADLGFEDIVSLNSVGSLKKELPPGTFVSCSEYVGLQQGPATYFDEELKGGAPAIANNLMPKLVADLAPENC